MSILQRSDEFHFRKRISKNRPDLYAEMAPGGKEAIPWWIRLHRTVGVPFRKLRRRLLTAIRVRDGNGQAASEHFAEDAVRREAA